MSQTFLLLAAIFGFTGVAIVAFGAHGLSAHFAANPTLQPTFETASKYHLIHAVALLGVAWACAQYPGRWTTIAGFALVAGILLFSGSLYILSIFNVRWMGAIAPFGGVALLIGWACLGIQAWVGLR